MEAKHYEEEVPVSPVIYLRLHFQVSKGSGSKSSTIPADLYIQKEASIWFDSKRDEILTALAELIQSNYGDLVLKSKVEPSEGGGLSRINGEGIAIAYGIRPIDSTPYTLLSTKRHSDSDVRASASVPNSLKICDMGGFMLAPLWLFPYNAATDAGKALPLCRLESL